MHSLLLFTQQLATAVNTLVAPYWWLVAQVASPELLFLTAKAFARAGAGCGHASGSEAIVSCVRADVARGSVIGLRR